VRAGAWRFTDTCTQEELRKEARLLNTPEDQAPLDWDTAAPKDKDNNYFRRAARESDEQIISGINPDNCAHSRKKTGVKASHVFQKLSYWQESIRGPDPMHTIGGCIKSIFTMVGGQACTTDLMRLVAEYEHGRNGGRWVGASHWARDPASVQP
jgi:hypothetical protein